MIRDYKIQGPHEACGLTLTISNPFMSVTFFVFQEPEKNSIDVIWLVSGPTFGKSPDFELCV